jgi:hypothetical protein
MEGTLLDINKRLALLYYHQPLLGLAPSGTDELIVHVHSMESNTFMLQRTIRIHALNHAQVSSVRFSSSGNEIIILARKGFTTLPGEVPCTTAFSTSSVVAMDAQSCTIDGTALTVTSSVRATIKPGEKISIRPEALWANETEAASYMLPVNNDLDPSPCTTQITQASVSLCSGISGYLRASDASNREPHFIWGSRRGSCALQSYLAGVNTRELTAPKELLQPEALELDLQAVCVNFMGQYGEQDEVILDISPDTAPRPQILMPDLIKVISGFDVGIIGSVTQPGLMKDGCLPVDYSQLESRCCPSRVAHPKGNRSDHMHSSSVDSAVPTVHMQRYVLAILVDLHKRKHKSIPRLSFPALHCNNALSVFLLSVTRFAADGCLSTLQAAKSRNWDHCKDWWSQPR